jgi:two-component system, NtrC family, response regulator AtoC
MAISRQPTSRVPSSLRGAETNGTDSTPGPVLVVELDPLLQRHLVGLLAEVGYEAMIANSVDEALSILEDGRCAFTLLGVNIGGDEGSELLRRLRTHGGDAGPVITLTRGEEMPEATSLGATHLIGEPVTREDLEHAIKQACSSAQRIESALPSKDSRVKLEVELSLWCSPRMQEVRHTIKLIANADVTVLICGETGTGKDVVARAVHQLSARRSRPFVKVNCAALPLDLLESELFGHERGAFTGAHELKIGKFELANHGTIFLDEIGDLHPALQGKLLYVLQDGQFSRVGGKSTIKVDVRILAATNQDLERNVAAGTFREDLFYRLNVIHIVVPPLRERLEEVVPLAQYFIRRYSELFQREPVTLAPETLRRLMQHRYAGNVRELENVIKRMIVLNDPYLLKNGFAPLAPPSAAEAPAGPKKQPVPTVSLKEVGRRAAQDAERAAILQMLEQTRWNRLRAAKLLNISYRALLYKMKEAGISPGREGSNAHE